MRQNGNSIVVEFEALDNIIKAKKLLASKEKSLGRTKYALSCEKNARKNLGSIEKIDKKLIINRAKLKVLNKDLKLINKKINKKTDRLSLMDRLKYLF